MFVIHQSNRLEKLLGQLSSVLETPLTSVMTPETVIVQSQGMARWLSLEIARDKGICANLDCPFPAAFIWRLLKLFTDQEGLSPYEPEAMAWSVMEIVGAQKGQAGFSQVAAYVDRRHEDFRRYQLSVRIAGLLDQYMVYRPEWVRQWSAGEESHWQALVWRELLVRHGNCHRVNLADTLLYALDADFVQRAGLPERISLFGIPALPQSQLDILVKLAEFIDVHLFLLSPTPHFWADLVGDRKMAQEQLRNPQADLVEELFFEEGCPLLMSLGRMGRDFQNLLLSYDGLMEESDYVEPGVDSVLAMLQSDLMAGIKAADPVQLSGADRSFQIHIAHSPMREVEILHDQLLEILNSDAAIEAPDILVMVPDIERYAPFVEAVFSASVDGMPLIPFSIADRGAVGVVVKSFFDLLDTAGSRAPVSRIIELLEQEPIAERFGITADDLTKISSWVKGAGVRWGIDEHHRQTLGGQGEGTWQSGLDRMMLGYLCSFEKRQLFKGVLPYAELEGGDGECLAKLQSFMGKIFSLIRACEQNHSLADWCDLLHRSLDDFFAESEEYFRHIQKIREGLNSVSSYNTAAKGAEELSCAVMNASLQKLLTASAGNFLCGRVTFCQMVPMRSIPFKVICLLGMNDDSFPRQDRPLGFDLMKERRPGDRCRRDDDRYLFMETILSARSYLYISYVGLSDRDHRRIPPTVLVSELLDYLALRCNLSAKECEERFATCHPLQPFSKRYFKRGLVSYSTINREVAARLGGAERYEGLQISLPTPVDDVKRQLEIDEFIRFFEHPVRYLLRNRLGVYLDDFFDDTEDRDCFSLNNLDKYMITAEFTELAATGGLGDDALLAGQLQGVLPAEEAGRYYFDELSGSAGEMAARLNALCGPEAAPLSVDLEVQGVRLTGVLDSIWATGQYLSRPVRSQGVNLKDQVRTWIRHLLLNAVAAPGQTCFICKDGGFRYGAISGAEAVAELGILVDLYIVGQSVPLPLFPRASFAYAKALWGGSKQKEPPEGLELAWKIWTTDGYYDQAEGQENYLAAAYGESNPLMGRGKYNFERVAKLVLDQALALAEKIGVDP